MTADPVPDAVPRGRGRRWPWWLLCGVLAAAVLGVATAAFHAGTLLTAAAPAVIGAPPPDLPMAAVEFTASDGSLLKGWYLAGEAQAPGVVLVHGIRGDRRSMLSRARFLHGLGYAVLLFDLRAHGESPGDRITLGAREALDVRAAVAWLEARRPSRPIAAIGTSLGGAACLLGGSPLAVDALVLEAVYPDIERAVANRLRIRFGALGPWLAPLLLAQIEPRLGVRPSALRPVDAIRSVRAPVLVVAGGRDLRTRPEESAELFAAAPQPKEYWEIADAGHVDFHRLAPAIYEQKVAAFLVRALGPRLDGQ
jgi:pimeloyl-ACP methyl ester carboxylesterase